MRSVFIAAVIFGTIPGLFFYIMNWVILIKNSHGEKWSSNIPPLGGIIIAVIFLLSPYKILALAGLTDPGFWLILYAIISEKK